MEPILELTEPHAIALCDSIQPGGVHPIQLQDVELVLWRDYAGQAHVWHDRCPHRGMRLSFGFVKENRLTCLYHAGNMALMEAAEKYQRIQRSPRQRHYAPIF